MLSLAFIIEQQLCLTSEQSLKPYHLFLLNIDGIDLDARADFNRTPIQVAEEMGENEIVYLIKSFKENSKKRK